MTSDRLSVAILTQYFYPEIPGTAQISTDLALGLVEAGFDVHVFTGQPAYWGGTRLPSREVYKGISIHRARSLHLSRNRLSGKGHISRLLGAAAVGTVTFFKLMRHPRPRALLVDSTSPFLLVVGWLLHVLRGVPYVFLVHDVYPEIAIQLDIVGQRSLAARLWRQTYRRVYEGASRIVVLGPRMRDIVRRSLRPASYDKCVIIPNWADGDNIVPRSKEDNPLRHKLGLTDKLVVLYSGNMGPPHDMGTVLEGVDRLRHVKHLQFLFIGDGGSRDWVASTVQQRNLTNVLMLPYQPQEVLPYSLTCGDISLVTQKRGMEGLSVPSKIYSSLAAGLAILAVMGPASEIGDIVEENGCGYRVEQGDVEGLVAAIERLIRAPTLLNEMKKKARACFEERFARTISISRYVSLTRSVATDSQPDNGAGID